MMAKTVEQLEKGNQIAFVKVIRLYQDDLIDSTQEGESESPEKEDSNNKVWDKINKKLKKTFKIKPD